MGRAIWAGVAGVGFAGLGAWVGQRLGGDAGSAGLGAAVGAVSGAFAPSVASWVTDRTAAGARATLVAELSSAVERPSRLLDPRRGVVPFAGRDNELADLVAWCERDNAPRVRLITGAGGVGKTRLALRLAQTVGQLGWRCKWLGAEQERTAITDIRAATAGRVLLIVDYAETRTGLPALIRAAVADEGTALRVLLVARSAGQWWEQLHASEPAIRELVDSARPEGMVLGSAFVPELSDDQLVRLAIPAFADELGVPPPSFVDVVLRAGRARVLELHAAALVAVLESIREPAGAVIRVDLTDILDELLSHEARFWLGSAMAQGLLDGPAGLTTAMVKQIVAVSCLLGAQSEAEAIEELGRVPGVPKSAKVAAWLRELYPADPTGGDWLGALQPDRLAERHVLAQLGKSDELAQRCLNGLNERQARRAVILLARAATESYLAEQFLARLLPQVSQVIADIQAPRETLVSIANAIPYPSVTLASAHAAIVGRLLDTLPRTAHPIERALWLEALGVMLAQLGSPGEALRVTEETVAIRRDLAAAAPDRHLNDLARSLNNLGNRFIDLGGHAADALRAMEEGTVIRRELMGTDPDRYRPDLAAALSNLSLAYAGLGRSADELRVTEEAVAIRRQLAAAEPDKHRPELATTLNNLSAALSRLGRSADALHVMEETIVIRRELAAAEPDKYRPDLASSLMNFGTQVAEMGRPADAVPITEEAVAIYRELAVVNPSRFRPGLARSLTNLSVQTHAASGAAEALPAIEEAVAIDRELAAADPGRECPQLAGSLTNLGIVYSALGRAGDALRAAHEAVGIYRDLAATSPGRERPRLAGGLINLGGRLAQLGRHADALAVTEEAVHIYRELAATNPGRYRSDLARSLSNLGTLTSALGHPGDALPFVEEAVAIHRELAAANPQRFRPDLDRSLSNLEKTLLRADAMDARRANQEMPES